MPADTTPLTRTIRSSTWMMRVLEAVRDDGVREGWAAVHTWYADRFGGGEVEPLVSIDDAVGTWPETATAVAVRVTADDVIEVCAPLGLADLLDGVWRRNPRRMSVERSRGRLERHQPRKRWPGVTVIPPADHV